MALEMQALVWDRHNSIEGLKWWDSNPPILICFFKFSLANLIGVSVHVMI